VCAKLNETLPNDAVVGEEDATELRGDDQAELRTVVVEQVRTELGEVDESQVLDFIDRGGADGSTNRYWTIDPIDGTKGFLRGEQYAVALGLIIDGQVQLGVLGCPNLSNPIDGSTGLLMVAARGQGTRVLPIDGDNGEPVQVSDITEPAAARFCESVESGHSSHGDAEKIAELLGITAESVRLDSQCKYAVVARGEASIYLRLPTRKDYREKIWDHAAGMIAVEEAGGTVTDVTGKPLDFTHGRQLENNAGVIATNGAIHDAVVKAVREVLGA
jgi:3'(2'), 5'-bisphosphate nucleotidase